MSGQVRVLAFGPTALLAEVADAATALALATWVRERGVRAAEVVPAARTVLLDGLAPAEVEATRAMLAAWQHEESDPAPGSGTAETAPVELPVVYDGPDLDDVAALWGVSREEVVARHTGLELVSLFCGFAPGFAYLSGLPPEWAVPRLDSPRPRVPAGSVAVADTWCGVYPSASPGGWRLLGRTDARLWDVARDSPALLAPGTRVRFVVASAGECPMSHRHVEVLASGPLCTVQDHGRLGQAHLGVPRAGPLDRPAAALANRLVGNPPGSALLEVTWGGLAVRPGAPTWIAVTGAAAPVSIDGRPVALARAELVPAGAVLRLGIPGVGVRSYVALAGGVDVDPVLGSRATDTLAGVGPPVLGPGQELRLGVPVGPPAPVEAPAASPGGAPTGLLRVHPGPRLERLGPGALADLCATSYAVGGESNRVGLRLDGRPLSAAGAGELPSEGMVLGAVQVPPSGLPVVLLADHPPTGGYPVAAVVEAADLWQCAQLRPGERVRFTRAR